MIREIRAKKQKKKKYEKVIPINPRHYWRYRMHLTIEQLLKEDNFNENIKTLITQSGRK